MEKKSNGQCGDAKDRHSADSTAPLRAGFIQLQSQMVSGPKRLSQDDWNQAVESMTECGMQEVIIQGVREDEVDFLEIAPQAIGWLLDACHNFGLDVFVGLKIAKYDSTRWCRVEGWLKQLQAEQVETVEAFQASFGNALAVRGWYIPLEVSNDPGWYWKRDDVRPHCEEQQWAWGHEALNWYFRSTVEACRRIADRPVAISPAINPRSDFRPERFAEEFARLIQGIEVDRILFQDGVGERKIPKDDIEPMVKPFFEALKATNLPGELWGNVESFRKTSPDTRVPADFDRFSQQVEVIGRLTEGLVTFDFYHYMNPTGHCCENEDYQQQQKALYDSYRHAYELD